MSAMADTLVATLAGGLVLLVFCPFTFGAAGLRYLVRRVRLNLLRGFLVPVWTS